MNAVLGLSARRVATTAALAAVVVVGGSSLPVQATQSTAKSGVLAKAPISPTHIFASGDTSAGHPWALFLATHGVTDGYVVQNDIPSGSSTSTGWHAHPGPSLVFVVAGSVTNYASDQPQCRGVTYSAGMTFVDEGGTEVHELVNKGPGRAETIAVQFIPQGKDRRIDAAEPANCHV
jgi:quercetin dioxygenase-like cupin family protein